MRPLLPWSPPFLALAVVLAFLLLACGGGGGPTTVSPAPFGLTGRPAPEGLAFPTGRPDPSGVGVVRAFGALTFERPVFLSAAPDGSAWLYVVEQAGRILVFPDRSDADAAATFLDIRPLVSRSHDEEGLLGLAFDPDWDAHGGTFYVYYSAANPRRSVLARYAGTFAADDVPVADGESGEIVLQIPEPYGNHDGGMLAFGPDGMLYVSVGDGGSANDPEDNAQDRTTLLGGLLRLDVRGRATYAVPSDNPLAGEPGLRGELWAWGLRNPWRFSFDRGTGDLWVGDVGQGEREEIDRVTAGSNLGWPVYEGTRSHRNPAGLPPGAFSPPVLDYPRVAGTCVIGGYVYRGTAVPSLLGAYVYGDYGSGGIRALVHVGTSVVSNDVIGSVGQVASFGEDARGELYAVSLAGTLWRFEEQDPTPPPAMPERLSETGLFRDLATLEPNPGLVPYDVRAPLYSDGALKQRWIGLPPTGSIAFDDTGPWAFPVGTVLVKHFELPLVAGDPASARRLETRVLVNMVMGWSASTYRWNDAQDDALLLTGAETATLVVRDPGAPGGERTQIWEFPAPSDCFRCHTDAAGTVLGVHTRQLNREFAYPAATDNQLRAWNHVGLFDVDLAPPASYPAFAVPSDAGAPVDARARAYLHANCAQCHRPGGPAPGGIDLRAGTSEAQMALLDVPPTEGDLGLEDARRVAPGAPSSSVLWERMRRTDGTRMPPLGSRVADPAGVGLIETWIRTR